MPTVPISPRPLSVSERAVLEHILSCGFDGAAELRSQLDRTEVVARWSAESTSVDLRVREPVQHAALPSRLVPVGAQVVDESGEFVGELLVWTDEGATLSGLEFAWVTDVMPTSLPPVDRIRLI
ncbi:hypothetical protein [Kutzneria sp. 744]|uniref:hypothetical protein n=1 Tax=Kutzneria sp. (strain 744) TaxID=345341 RepID=UPI0003EEAE0E|nr:hypothetical protein [Kutzneria sp. 744]EWM13059.1 hypothetical protein KUTG_03363 [Kutzneria sp. 744]